MKTIMHIKSFLFLFLLLFVFWGCDTTPPINQAPIITSNALTSIMLGESYSYDVEASDPDGDTLTYTLTESPIGMTIDSSTGIITWTPSAEGDNEITIQASDGELIDTQSFTLTVSMTDTTLSPPTGVSASDGDCPFPDTIIITWNPVSDDLYYQVYRSDSLTGTKIPRSGWQMSTTYYDGDIIPETTYYYWVKAATSPIGDISDYSDYDTGWAWSEISSVLSPPTGVEATNVLFDKVQITWNPVSGATHYRVYRSNSLTGTKTAISDWQTGTFYDDNSITPEQIYYYWVKAATSSTGANASDYSNYDTGWAPAYIPSAPNNVNASDHYFDRVEVTWDSTSVIANYYQVYRADSLTGTRAAISKWQTGTSYDDKSAAPGFIYYYWVKAATTSTGGNPSPYSIYDTGKRLGGI